MPCTLCSVKKKGSINSILLHHINAYIGPTVSDVSGFFDRSVAKKPQTKSPNKMCTTQQSMTEMHWNLWGAAEGTQKSWTRYPAITPFLKHQLIFNIPNELATYFNGEAFYTINELLVRNLLAQLDAFLNASLHSSRLRQNEQYGITAEPPNFKLCSTRIFMPWLEALWHLGAKQGPQN